jgi:hypothetical protein
VPGEIPRSVGLERRFPVFSGVCRALGKKSAENDMRLRGIARFWRNNPSREADLLLVSSHRGFP